MSERMKKKKKPTFQPKITKPNHFMAWLGSQSKTGSHPPWIPRLSASKTDLPASLPLILRKMTVYNDQKKKKKRKRNVKKHTQKQHRKKVQKKSGRVENKSTGKTNRIILHRFRPAFSFVQFNLSDQKSKKKRKKSRASFDISIDKSSFDSGEERVCSLPFGLASNSKRT